MVILKSRDEIATMRRAGRVVARALERVAAAVRPGVTLRELDELGARTITREGATASFLGYHPRFAPTPFPASLCLSVNEVIVHGIPDRRRLRDGDVLSIDCGAVVGGYHADAAVTVPVGEVDPATRRLLEVTERALWAGIELARVGNRLSDISHAVGQVAHAAGYGILADHGGHGVGQLLHEDPSVDNDGRPGRGPRLRDGLVLAIEPMFVDGDPAYRHRPDGWAVATRDGSRAAPLLRLDRAAEATAALEAIAADEPWRERTVELLVTASPRRPPT
ncbi:MAG: type I methionyl aminopeptidase, partial [Actinomycetota bacterium]